MVLSFGIIGVLAFLLVWGISSAYAAEGEALNCDGDGDYVRVDDDDDSLDLGAGSFTIEAWIKPAAPGGYQWVVSKDVDTVDVDYLIGMAEDECIFVTRRGNANIISSADLDISAGKWYHIAGVQDTGTNKVYLYVNGVWQVEADLAGDAIPNADPLLIGARGGGDEVNEFFNGIIDEVRIWNVERSETQIRDWMHKTNDLNNETGLVSVWRLDGDLTDSKGGNDGTLFGNPTLTPSSAPFGREGAFVATTSQTSVGPEGGEIQVTITSTPGDANNLGIYQLGGLGGPPVKSGEILPDHPERPLDKRSKIVWGIVERGSVTADVTIDYSNVEGIENAATLTLLKRDDAGDTTWVDWGEPPPGEHKFDNNPGDFTFTDVSDLEDFGEFAIGAEEDNPLPVTVSAFTSTNTKDGVLISWRAETEIDNIGFAIYRSEKEDGDYTRIAFLEGAGNSGMSIDYQFNDETVEAGKTYFYFLEDVSIAGDRGKSEIIKVVVPLTKTIGGIPKEFRLLQNYPNPFNPETWIPYDLPTDTAVVVRIYDVEGHLVRQLDLGTQKAGSYIDKGKAAYWDGKDQGGQMVSNGLYFYTLQAADFQATKRMVIVK